MKRAIGSRSLRRQQRPTTRSQTPVRPTARAPRRGSIWGLPSRSHLTKDDFKSAADVMQEPKPEFLVEDLLFPGAPFSIFGLPEVGKSLIALLLAACVAARKPFLGKAVNLTQAVSVIYVAAEGKRFIGARLRAISTKYKLAGADLRNLHILRRPIALTDLSAVDEFINAVRVRTAHRARPVLIIFDTLTKCLGRAGADENSPRDMAMVADCIDAIIEATGAAVGVVDHTGWKTKHERGHSNKRANVETAMLVTRAPDGTVKVTSEKANHSDRFKPISLRIERCADAMVITLSPFTIVPRETRDEQPLLENDERALRALSNESAGLAFTRWANVSGLPQATLARRLRELLAAKLVTTNGSGHRKRYSLTTAGKRRVSELATAE